MAYIGVSPSNGVRRKHTYTATAAQTSFSGAGAEGATLSYNDSNFVDVYQNGVKLSEADYTSTSGTAIVLAQGASVSDIVEIVVFDVFSVADTVSKADGGTFDGNVTAAGTLAVTGTLTTDDVSVVGRAFSPTLTTNLGSAIDLSLGNNFLITTTGDVVLTFTNQIAGQSGTMKFVNDSDRAVTAHTNVAISEADLATISATGTYMVSYFVTAASAANTILVSASAILT